MKCDVLEARALGVLHSVTGAAPKSSGASHGLLWPLDIARLMHRFRLWFAGARRISRDYG